jgi:hypothetical protein
MLQSGLITKQNTVVGGTAGSSEINGITDLLLIHCENGQVLIKTCRFNSILDHIR